jgi:hypothetical protein
MGFNGRTGRLRWPFPPAASFDGQESVWQAWGIESVSS